MKELLTRFWRWLLRFFGLDGTAAPPAAPVPPPPVAPPTFDLPITPDAQFSVWASLVTNREAVVYRTLHNAAAGQFEVMAKVRLWDFIHLESEPANKREFTTRLSCRHVDFLLCDRYTLRPRLGIELDDHSHLSPKGVADDRFKDDLFKAAGLPLLRLDKPNYSASELRRRIEAALGLKDEARS